MGRPVAPAKGIAFAFPDVCKTPSPPGSPIPIPYPNIAPLNQATPVTTDVLVGPSGDAILLKDATISPTSGDEAGSVGGVKSSTIKGTCKLVEASKSVVYGPQKKGLVRFMDPTEQNEGNAAGMVLGAFPTVLVGD